MWTMFTREDVSRAADVFLNWFTRQANKTENTYDDDVLSILEGQKDSFVSLVAKIFHLDSTVVEATKRQMFAAPVTIDQLSRLMPGLGASDIEGMTGDEKQALVAIAKTVHK